MSQQSPETQINDCVDLLRMGEAEIKIVLSELDAMGGEGKGKAGRRAQRRRYQKNKILVQLQGINSLSKITYRMVPSDLSSTGISLLHGAFVYPGTPCLVTLNAIDGEMVSIPGQIVRCRLITGRAHEIGAKFSDPIELNNFVASKRID